MLENNCDLLPIRPEGVRGVTVPHRFLMIVSWLAITILLVSHSADAKIKKKPFSVPVTANDIVYVPTVDRLYATVTSESTRSPDTVVVINPKKGKIVNTINVGRQPRRLALSDDYRYLYVEVTGPRLVQIDLTNNTIVSEFSIRWGPFTCEDLLVSDVKVMPGHPETIAVAVFCREFSGVSGIAIFDKGIPRPVVSSDATSVGRFCFGTSPDVIWGYNTVNDSFAFWKFRVDEQGVTVEGDGRRGLVFGFHQSLELYNDLIYTTKGRVIDPENRALDGRYISFEVLFASAFAMDTEAGLVYFTTRVGSELILSCFDLKTYLPVSYYQGKPYGLGNATTRLVRCGKGGLAAIGDSEVVFFPLAMLKPLAPYKKPNPAPISQEVRSIALPARGLIYDSEHRALYATTPSAIGSAGNSIVRIDPFAGTVGEPLWIGSEPWQMTLSDQNRYLYASIYGAASVVRLKLPQLEPDLKFSLFTSPNSTFGKIPAWPYEMLPVRGKPESFIASLSNFLSSPGSEGVAIYDNGVKRPITAPLRHDFAPVNTIQLSESGDSIYGMDTESTGFSFAKMSFDDSGVHTVARGFGVEAGFNAILKCDGGLCFTSSGIIVDPEIQQKIGQFVFEDEIGNFLFDLRVCPDVKNGRIYFLELRQTGVYLVAYNLNTRAQIASFKVPGPTNYIGDFLIWNDDQFAFLADDKVFLVPVARLQNQTN